MSAPISVLARLQKIQAALIICGSGAPINNLQLIREFADNAKKARYAVAELIKAIRESRIATQEFANDGLPKNWIRYEASEARIVAALKKVGAV